MFLTFRCPRCEACNQTEQISAHSQLICSSCGWTKTVEPEQLTAEGTPCSCLRCGNVDLWRQKDFPQWLGLTFVAVGAISSSVAWGYHYPVVALGILLGFALLDMILYMTMSDVLVCYRCQSRHHRLDVGGYDGFNHELAERYRQERIRLQQSSRLAESPLDDIRTLRQG